MKFGIILLNGLPASGKSSLTNDIKVALHSIFNIFVIDFDKIIPIIDEKDIQENEWKRARDKIFDQLELFVDKIISGKYDKNDGLNLFSNPATDLNLNKDVIFIIDDNFFYRSMRRLYFHLAQTRQLGYGTISCHCPIDILLTRNKSRKNSVPLDVIIRMKQIMEFPDTRNDWERHVYEHDSTQPFDEEKIKLFFLTVLQNPYSDEEKRKLEEMKERDKLINMNSYLHNIDITLRKITGKLFKNNDSIWRKVNYKRVNDAKQATLDYFKNHDAYRDNALTVEEKFFEYLNCNE